MRRFLASLLLVAAAASSSAKLPIGIEAGFEYASIDGVRGYKAKNLNKAVTDDKVVPVFGVRVHPLSWLNAGISYRNFDKLETSGVAPDANIFSDDPQGPVVQVVTPYTAREDISEITVDARYVIGLLDDRLQVEAGPVASFYSSDAEFKATNGRIVRNFSSDDFKVGATAVVKLLFNDHWSIQASYRYAKPPSRDLHIFGGGVGYRF